MKKIGMALLAGIVAATMLSGCWNRKELNDLGIQMGAAVDKIGNQYKLTVQVVVPGEVTNRYSQGAFSAVTLYKSSGDTLFTAYRRLTETSPRKIYGAHTRALILGESVAKEGISNVLDLFIREPEVRSDFYVLVAKDTSAENVLRVLTPMEKIPANTLHHSMDTSSKTWAPTATVTLDTLVERLITEADNPVLTGIRVIGSTALGEGKQNVEEIDPDAKLRLAGLAVFRKDRLVGWLDEEESKGYNYIKNEVTSTAGEVECPEGGLVSLETLRSHTTMKGKVVRGKPHIDIRIDDESNIAEVACKIELNDQTARLLEKKLENRKIELMSKAVAAAKQKYKVDIFGFGQAIYRADPKAWSGLKAGWEQTFPTVEVNYDVHVYIRKMGQTRESIRANLKE